MAPAKLGFEDHCATIPAESYYPGMSDFVSNGTSDSASLLLRETVSCFRRQKVLADRALAQLRDEDWHAALDAESNSIAVIVQHMAGNLRSRWRDFLTTDGEKADRDRDGEFEDAGLGPSELLAAWEGGWAIALASLDSLTAADLGKQVTIRGEPSSVAAAVVRSLDHAAGHVGQIIMLAKHRRGGQWQTLTMPRRRRNQ